MVIKVYPHELIGEIIEIVDATNPSLQGMRGKIIDETKNTLHLLVDGKHKKVLKSQIQFRITRTGQMIVGHSIQRRPEERVKGR